MRPRVQAGQRKEVARGPGSKSLCGWFKKHHLDTWRQICAQHPTTCQGCVLNKQVKGLK